MRPGCDMVFEWYWEYLEKEAKAAGSRLAIDKEQTKQIWVRGWLASRDWRLARGGSIEGLTEKGK